MLNLEIKIIEKTAYLSIIGKYNGFRNTQRINYYKQNKESNDLFKELLNLSNYKCFYCGENLNSNHKNGFYFEKEHIIDKKLNQLITDTHPKYDVLLKCRKNLIPICKNCNSEKYLNNSNTIIHLIHTKCHKLKCHSKACDLLPYKLSKEYNFNFLELEKFDWLFKKYVSFSSKKIQNLYLNERNLGLYDRIFSQMYKVNYTSYPLEALKNTFYAICNNILEEKFIDFLFDNSIIKNNGPGNSMNDRRTDNLIETITLLEIT